MEFDVPGIGLGISLILAAPQLAGLLQLGAPPLIGRLVDRKRFCLAAYLLSALVLAALPWVAVPGRLPSAAMSLFALVALWCAYQVLEYLGAVALWSWLADLVPLRIRGRFLGHRERWMAAGQAVGMAAGGLLLWQWQQTWPDQPRWIGYARDGLRRGGDDDRRAGAAGPGSPSGRQPCRPPRRAAFRACWRRWPIGGSCGCCCSAAAGRRPTA